MNTHRTLPLPEGTLLVLFDDECQLCNGFIQFLIARDQQRRFWFAPLKGKAGRQACESVGLKQPEGSDPNTLVVIENNLGRVRSDAVLAIASQLPFPWSILATGRVVPRPVRDALYRWVARNRYRWFGRRTACPLTSAEIRNRFLE